MPEASVDIADVTVGVMQQQDALDARLAAIQPKRSSSSDFSRDTPRKGLTTEEAFTELNRLLNRRLSIHLRRLIASIPARLLHPVLIFLVVMEAGFVVSLITGHRSSRIGAATMLLIVPVSGLTFAFSLVAPRAQLFLHCRRTVRRALALDPLVPTPDAETVTVLRDGGWMTVSPMLLVPGDTIRVAQGDVAPAATQFEGFRVAAGDFVCSGPADLEPSASTFVPIASPPLHVGTVTVAPAAAALADTLHRKSMPLAGQPPFAFNAAILVGMLLALGADLVARLLGWYTMTELIIMSALFIWCPMISPIGINNLAAITEASLLRKFIDMCHAPCPPDKGPRAVLSAASRTFRPYLALAVHRPYQRIRTGDGEVELPYLAIASPAATFSRLRRVVILHESPYFSTGITAGTLHVPSPGAGSLESARVEEAADLIWAGQRDGRMGVAAKAIGLGALVPQNLVPVADPALHATLPVLADRLGFAPDAALDYTVLTVVDLSPAPHLDGWLCRLPPPELLVAVVRERRSGSLLLLARGSPDALIPRCAACWDGRAVRPLPDHVRSAAAQLQHQTAFASDTPCLAMGFTVVLPEEAALVTSLPPVVRVAPGQDHGLPPLAHLIFTGIVTTRRQTSPTITSVLESFDDIGVRIVWASGLNSRRSRALARDVGLWSEWNSCLSLTKSGEGEPLPVTDVNARLPRGLAEIRRQLDAAIDDLPLQVNVFSNACPADVGGLVDIFAGVGDTVVGLASCLHPTANLPARRVHLAVAAPPDDTVGSVLASVCATVIVPDEVSIGELSVHARRLRRGMARARLFLMATVAHSTVALLLCSLVSRALPSGPLLLLTFIHSAVAPIAVFAIPMSAVRKSIPPPTTRLPRPSVSGRWVLGIAFCIVIPAINATAFFIVTQSGPAYLLLRVVWDTLLLLALRSPTRPVLLGRVWASIVVAVALAVVGLTAVVIGLVTNFTVVGAALLLLVCGLNAMTLAVSLVVDIIVVRRHRRVAWEADTLAMLSFETKLGKWSPN